MRTRKRLNLSVLIIMLIFFSGSAFAYSMDDFIGSGRFVLLSETETPPLVIRDGRIRHSPGLSPTLEGINIGDITLEVDFDVTFSAPGQFVEYRFDIENAWDIPLPVNASNLSLNGLSPGDWPNWLLVELYPSDSFYIFPGAGSDNWGFTVALNPAIYSETYYLNETFNFNIGIAQPMPSEPTPEPPSDDEESGDVGGGEGESDESESDFVDMTPGTPDLIEPSGADEYFIIDDEGIPLAFLDGDLTDTIEYLDIDDMQVPLGSVTAPIEDAEYIYLEDIGIPLGAMPQTGVVRYIPLLVSGFLFFASVALFVALKIFRIRGRG